MAYAPIQVTPMASDVSTGFERGGIYLVSDENALSKYIEHLHQPDACRIDIRPLLHLIEETILHMDASDTVNLQDEAIIEGIEEFKAFPNTIDRISIEMKRQVLSGTSAHNVTLSVLRLLQHFSWDVKVVITLTAATVTFGNYFLRLQYSFSNPLAKAIENLQRMNDGQFEATKKLIKAMLDTTKCVVEFEELSGMYFTDEHPELKAARSRIPIAVYMIIKSAVIAAAQIITTMSSQKDGNMQATAELRDLETITDLLRNTLIYFNGLIEEERQIEAYNKTKKIFYDTMQFDNMEILRTLIYADDDMPPLYDGPAKRRVHLENLRRKNVLLLISGLDITHEELSILEESYSESKVHEYEVVWIPIIDSSLQWTDPMKVKLENLKDSMPWYSVHNPSLIRNAVIRFLTDDWHFHGKPMLVVLDSQGKVLSPNAIHMMWIWKNQAFPFTCVREEALWEQETWRLELLVDAIDQTILDWIREEKYILLYGGDDLKWIRQFTNEARTVAQTLQVPLEMVYVGRSHTKEEVHKICASIIMEQLSYCWQDPTFVWYFWTRIESMIYSKIQLGNVHDHGDTIWQEIQKLHSHDKSHSGWVVLAKGSRIIVHGQGKVAMTTLQELEKWKESAIRDGFDVGFGNHYTELHMQEYPCHRILFPSGMRIPGSMPCPDCRRPMHKNESFICCHEDHNAEAADVLAALTDVDQYET